jgi:hypothetical protein
MNAATEPGEAERLAHLERDRWPEFERELWARRPRRVRFDIHHYGAAPQRWDWLVHRCRNWTEVERVLNRHHVPWEQGRGEILIDRATIYRCR